MCTVSDGNFNFASNTINDRRRYGCALVEDVVGIPAHSMWRTAKGIEVFGPRHFGHDLDFVPIEALQKRRSKQFS